MRRILDLLAAGLVGVSLWLAFTAAHAQQPVVPYLQGTSPALPAPVTASNPLPVTMLSGGFPANSTAITGNSTGTTGAVVGSLAGASGKTTYICGFSVSAIGGTAAVSPIVIANTVTGSMTFAQNSSVAGTSQTVNFNPCIPASAANTAITTTTTADGTATAVTVNSWGFRL